jgi:hypothetical protein
VIERGLRKDRDERWPSMMEYGRALAQWVLAEGVDEDVCGTGIELKWLSGSKSPGRASLISVSFDPEEMPSSIRRARTSRGLTEAPAASTGHSGAPLDESAPLPLTRRPSAWVVGGVLFVAACVGAALALTSSSSEDASTLSPPKAAPPPPTLEREPAESEPAQPEKADNPMGAKAGDAPDEDGSDDDDRKGPKARSAPAALTPTPAAPAPRRQPVQVAPTLAAPPPEAAPTGGQTAPKKKPEPQDIDLKSPY